MEVVFRVDAALAIGAGHVMRCLTLADALGRAGATCRFVGREHPGHLLDLVRNAGYQTMALPLGRVPRESVGVASPQHAAWLGASWAEDAAQTAAAMADARPAWLVVDHYALDARWESMLRPQCGALMVIDDLADRTHDADLLLDQNLGRDSGDYASLVPPGCTVLTGAAYALLRPQFAELRFASLALRRHRTLQQLFIAIGGVDKDDVTSALLQALASCRLPSNCRVVVAMGNQAPWVSNVRDAAARLPWPVMVHVGAENMAELMTESDLAIGAAGSMAWERCSLGLPTLTVVLAENQRPSARALAAAGASIPLALPASAETLQGAIAQALAPGKLEQMQNAAARITDGTGVQRVLAHMRRQHARV